MLHVYSSRGARLRDVTFFAVLVDVEALSLDLWCNAQAKRGLQQEGNHGRAREGEQHRDSHRLQLLEPQSVANHWSQSVLPCRSPGEIWVRRYRCKDACQKRTECSADGMDTERVQGVVVAEPALQFCAGEERHNSSRNPD